MTDGIESAYAQARAAAGDRDISIAGGASCARQAIKAGLVDEIDLQVTAVILGSGERLFDGFEAGIPELELVRVLHAPGVAHLRYAVVRTAGNGDAEGAIVRVSGDRRTLRTYGTAASADARGGQRRGDVLQRLALGVDAEERPRPAHRRS